MIDLTQFQQQGFFTCQLGEIKALDKIKLVCENLARESFSDSFHSLEKYHEIELTAEQHDDFQYKLFCELNDKKLHHELVKDNIEFFKALFGPDIDIQTQLYLRIARPGKALDNIGMHRDTDYGNSAYEVSVSFPLVSQPEGCGLNIIPASHLFDAPEIEQFNRLDVNQGDKKNKMGFLYAPKKLLGLNEELYQCVSLPYGHALGFSLGVIHGQVENQSNVTRWNIDFRVKNSFHPLTKNLKHGYYSSLTKSVVRELAEDYYIKNEQEAPTLLAQAPK